MDSDEPLESKLLNPLWKTLNFREARRAVLNGLLRNTHFFGWIMQVNWKLFVDILLPGSWYEMWEEHIALLEKFYSFGDEKMGDKYTDAHARAETDWVSRRKLMNQFMVGVPYFDQIEEKIRNFWMAQLWTILWDLLWKVREQLKDVNSTKFLCRANENKTSSKNIKSLSLWSFEILVAKTKSQCSDTFLFFLSVVREV